MAWVTHSLGFAVTTAALVAAGSSTALAQSPAAQTQEPSPPPESSLSLFDNRLTKPKSTLESWLNGFEMKCTACGVFETTTVRPDSTNATAPWVMQGKWRRQTALGAVSAGFVGVRNYALPLFTAMPIGGDFDPGRLGSPSASTFAPFSQWTLTTSIEKTLIRRANGASIGITGDVLMPLKTGSTGVGDPRFGALTSPTLRLGIVIRW